MKLDVRTTALVALSASFLACATPEPPTMLLDAERDWRAASRDVDVKEYAPVALYEARKELDRAQRRYEDEPEDPEVEHLAYLGMRRVQIAQALAAQRIAETEAKTLSRQRDRALLDARERQVDLVRVEADRAAARARELERQLEELKAEKTDRGLVITLGDVLFDFNRADLRAGARQNLQRLVTFLREQPDRDVLIEGHTDATGSSTYNQSLSQRRAEAVRLYLVNAGISASRSVASGYGETHPVASNDTEAGRQQNRRVEIVILDPGVRAFDRVRR